MSRETSLGDALARALRGFEREVFHEVARLNLRAEREAIAHLVTEGEQRLENIRRLEREILPTQPGAIAAE